MRDTYGLVPPEIRAMVESEEAVDRQVGTARFIDKALKQHDPYLSLVFVKDVPEWDLPTGCVPARWHVQRKAPGEIPYYWPVVGPHGEFREPTFHIVEEMQERDLHREDAMRALRERQGREEAARQRAAALTDEQRRDELATDLRAGKRVAGDGGLTKRKWGKR